MEIKIDDYNMQNLEAFSEMKKKDISFLINEALEQYFENEQRKLLEKNLADENAMTNLDFDEFWDDVELD
jgi:predicted transcriptional regulator